mgnify:CR=1 FL=1
MSIERKPVTKAANGHPFESMGPESAPPPPTTSPAPRAEPAWPATSTRPTRHDAPAKPANQGADSAPAPKDPLITRTYRIPESLDSRMQAASLQLGVGRGRVVNKSDIVREGVEKFLAELGL